MKIDEFFKTTITGGLVFILPFAVLVVVFGKVASALRPVVHQVAEHVPLETVAGLRMPVLLTIVAILFICFTAGLLAKTRPARMLVGQLESNLLGRVPAYNLLKNISQDIADAEGQSPQNAILVRFDDAWQLGFRIEEIAGSDLVAVFIPDSPTPQTGAVMLVSGDRIKSTDVSMIAAFACLKKRGNGIGNILGT